MCILLQWPQQTFCRGSTNRNPEILGIYFMGSLREWLTFDHVYTGTLINSLDPFWIILAGVSFFDAL